MALLHRTSLVPGKLELVNRWINKQPWFSSFSGSGSAAEVGSVSEVSQVAAFRFDDPEGLVGIETLLVASPGGPILQVPLTYRNDPLEGAERFLLGTMEHGVLGTRWTYDALGDPVYRQELARTILTGGTQVEQWIELDGVMTRREPTAAVVGSGTDRDPNIDDWQLDVVRLVGTGTVGPSDFVLTGTWVEHPEPVVLAVATPR
jgi:hypothetical protein